MFIGQGAGPSVGTDGTVFVGIFATGVVYALDGRTGTPRWNVTVAERAPSPIVLGADGTAFITGADPSGPGGNHVCAVNGTTGSQLWCTTTPQWIMQGASIGSQGRLLLGANTRGTIIGLSDG